MNYNFTFKCKLNWGDFAGFVSTLILFCILPLQSAFSQPMSNEAPMIGAEIFIEPGQTPEEIDIWYRLMKENGLSICRIRMFETYMHKPDGSWDYSLFDMAYKAAEKYGIKVWGNLFPATDFTDVGGFKFPRSEEHLKAIAEYTKNLVTHFKQFKSSYGWVLINEPGSGSLPKEEFTTKKFAEWKSKQPKAIYNSKGYNIFEFNEERFLVEYNTWFLNWLAAEVYKYDPGSHLHVNNHAIFQNVAEYNFPEWRKFLTSLGGSAHASWHFGYFKRNQYAVAMSANCEIIRSGAGKLPWLMTEIQGGNNTYSGFAAMCPTKEEIDQWLWTVVGSGGKGGIFWCMNPRASGFEAGEWAMINFLNEPSDRLIAASSVAKTISNNKPLFANAQPVESGINILYTRESLWIEKTLQTGGPHFDGRDVGGVMKSALSYFEALGEMGIQSNLKEIDEFDFTKTDYKGYTIILAHQVCIPSRYWISIENFVTNGGKLIVDGLTAYYDENAHCIMKTGFPLGNLFGGTIKEFKITSNLFDVKVTNPAVLLTGHLWQGTIHPTTGKPIARNADEVIATRNSFGKGEVVWIPSLVGLGGRLSDYSNLVSFLSAETMSSLSNVPIRFKNHHKGMFIKTLLSGNTFITIIVNKSESVGKVELLIKRNQQPEVMFADKHGNFLNSSTLSISPEETVVIKWQ
jgi:beta-galactosidase